MADTMTERRQRLHDEREVPWGYELVAVRDRKWRLESGRRCRYSARGHQNCGKPSAAALNRGRPTDHDGRVDSWWAYCPEHMYATWVEGGVVMHWILREVEPTP